MVFTLLYAKEPSFVTKNEMNSAIILPKFYIKDEKCLRAKKSSKENLHSFFWLSNNKLDLRGLNKEFSE
jgi:hypothetical protein